MSAMGIIYDDRYLKHDTGLGHPERPERLVAIRDIITSHNKLISLKPREATKKEIQWVHNSDHVDRILEMKGSEFFMLDADTPMSPGTTDAALLAVGGVIECVRQVEEESVSSAFAFPRPPGHHAETNRAMGFCIFNNIAIAAEYLIKEKNMKRVAIVDYDVHHGNGTQHSFYDREDVFYISTHRFPFFPGTGSEKEKGEGAGAGYTLNLPFSAYADDDDYRKSFEEKIIPALEKYNPEFILVSAGFDAHILDPLGGMKLRKTGFNFMNEKLMSLAKKCCGGKIVFVLEGGYDLKGLQEGVESVFESV